MFLLKVTIGACLIAGTLGGVAMTHQPSPSVQPTPPAPPPPTQTPAAVPVTEAKPVEIGALAFLAGSWSGDMGGSYVEENWSRPHGTSIVGTFRWLKPDGSPTMFEMLAITREDDAVRLRLRHYSGKLVAKEDADKPMTLRLIESTASSAVFKAESDAGALERIVYAVEEGVLAIDVVFAPPPADQPDARPRPPLRFRLKRTDL